MFDHIFISVESFSRHSLLETAKVQILYEHSLPDAPGAGSQRVPSLRAAVLPRGVSIPEVKDLLGQPGSGQLYPAEDDGLREPGQVSGDGVQKPECSQAAGPAAGETCRPPRAGVGGTAGPRAGAGPVTAAEG